MASITKNRNGPSHKAQVVLRQPNKTKGHTKITVSSTQANKKLATEYGVLLDANLAVIKSLGIKIYELPLPADDYAIVAKKLGSSLLPEIKARIAPEQMFMTVHEAVEKYIASGRSLKTDRPAKEDKTLCGHLAWWDSKIGSKNLVDVDDVLVDDWLDIKAKEKTTRARGRNGTEAPVSVATINRCLSAMSVLLRWGQRKKWIAHFPLPQGFKRKGEPEPNPRPLGNTEFSTELNMDTMNEAIVALLEACEYLDGTNEYRQKFRQLKLAVQLYLATGQRSSEVMAMEWKKMDLTKGKGSYKVMTKGKKEKKFVLVEGARKLLSNERKRQMKDGTMQTFVFGIPGKRETVYLNLDDNFEKAALMAEMPDLRVHDLRDTAATMMLNSNNGNFALVAKMLGHSSVGALQLRYAQWFDDTIRDEQEQAISSAVFS